MSEPKPNSNTKQEKPVVVKPEPYDHHDWLLELTRRHEELFEFVNANKNPQAGGIVRRIMQHLNQDLRHLQVTTGMVVDMSSNGYGSGNGIISNENPLIGTAPKQLFGISVEKGRKPSNSNSFLPKKNEVENFKNEVENLYKAFLSLKDVDVENLAAKPNGELLIRGVAKKAGLKNWETADVDIYLYANIREGITSMAKEKASAQAFSNEMNENE